MIDSQRHSRRAFLKQSRALVGGAAVATVVPSAVLGAPGKPGANNRVLIGFIGVGNRAQQLIDHVPEEGRIVAISDVYLKRAEDTLKNKKADWPVYQDYRKMIDKERLDAVVVPTPDHGRVLPSIHACQAGLDVYAEKPLTLTIREGRALVDAVRRHKRVFQTGSQQRTMEMNRFACELVCSGGIGKLRVVLGVNYGGIGPCGPRPAEPTPQGLDWAHWCGQTELVPFNNSLYRGWMGCRRYSGGQMTNWGPHGLDQVQWALGMSNSGPVELWPESEGISGKVSFRYANGIVVRLELDKGPFGGAIFVGEKAKIEINRNKFTTNPPDFVQDPPEPATAKIWEGPGWIARPHIQNWLDCIKSRERPNADVEIGHRSVSLCHLANITRWVGRKLKWDPEKEIFPGDDQANAFLDRPRRKGYELPDPL